MGIKKDVAALKATVIDSNEMLADAVDDLTAFQRTMSASISKTSQDTSNLITSVRGQMTNMQTATSNAFTNYQTSLNSAFTAIDSVAQTGAQAVDIAVVARDNSYNALSRSETAIGTTRNLIDQFSTYTSNQGQMNANFSSNLGALDSTMASLSDSMVDNFTSVGHQISDLHESVGTLNKGVSDTQAAVNVVNNDLISFSSDQIEVNTDFLNNFDDIDDDLMDMELEAARIEGLTIGNNKLIQQNREYSSSLEKFLRNIEEESIKADKEAYERNVRLNRAMLGSLVTTAVVALIK